MTNRNPSRAASNRRENSHGAAISRDLPGWIARVCALLDSGTCTTLHCSQGQLEELRWRAHAIRDALTVRESVAIPPSPGDGPLSASDAEILADVPHEPSPAERAWRSMPEAVKRTLPLKRFLEAQIESIRAGDGQ